MLSCVLTLHSDSGELECSIPYDPAINEMLKEAWGRGSYRFSTTTRTWWVPISRLEITVGVLRRSGYVITQGQPPKASASKSKSKSARARVGAKEPSARAKASTKATKEPKPKSPREPRLRYSVADVEGLVRAAFDKGYQEGLRMQPAATIGASASASNTNPWLPILTTLPKKLRDRLYRQAALALHADSWPGDDDAQQAGNRAMVALNAARKTLDN
jgi:hypothetical protein